MRRFKYFDNEELDKLLDMSIEISTRESIVWGDCREELFVHEIIREKKLREMEAKKIVAEMEDRISKYLQKDIEVTSTKELLTEAARISQEEGYEKAIKFIFGEDFVNEMTDNGLKGFMEVESE